MSYFAVFKYTKKFPFVRVGIDTNFVDFLIVMLLFQNIVYCRFTSSSSEIAKGTNANVSWITEELIPAYNATDTFSSFGQMQNESLLFLQFVNVLFNLYEKRLFREREQIQSDQPQEIDMSNINVSKSLEVTNGTRSSTKRNNSHVMEMKELAKESRIAEIAALLQNIRQFSGKNSSKLTGNYSFIMKVESLPMWPKTAYKAQSQDIFPSCSLPKPIEQDEWHNSRNMNLYFNLDFPKSAADTVLRISEAKLRLYKLPVKMYEGNTDTIDGSAVPEIQEAIKKSDIPQNVANAMLTDSIAEEKKIKVSVYYYTRPVKKFKEGKKKHLDTKMLYASKEEITEWDIKKAAKAWQNDSNRNFGIAITVEDEKAKFLSAHQFFNIVNCTKMNELPIAIPKIVLEHQLNISDVNKQDLQNKTTLENWKNYYKESIRLPALQITTEEVPIQELVNKSFEQRRTQFVTNIQNKDSLLQNLHDSSISTHKHRHGHKKSNENDKLNQNRNSTKESLEEQDK
ncbi:hypothetical protein PGB90_010073 [Kerria lacca]